MSGTTLGRGPLVRGQVLCSLAVLLGACGATYSPHVRIVPRPAPPIVVEAGRAAVVFVNPTGMGWDAYVRILDEEGRYLCDVSSSSYCVAQLAPGEHTFLARGSQAMTDEYGALRAELAEGGLYAVQVIPIGEGPWACLNAVQEGNRTTAFRDWVQVIRQSTALAPDLVAAQAAEDQRGRLPRERVTALADAAIHVMQTQLSARGCAGAGLSYRLRSSDTVRLSDPTAR